MQRVDLEVGLGRRGESSLGSLASIVQTAHSTLVVGDVLLVLALELLRRTCTTGISVLYLYFF